MSAGGPITIEEFCYMAKLIDLCTAYCKQIGADLLFVTILEFGYQMPDGTRKNHSTDELRELLRK